jgi:hypothetical protein
MLKSYENYINGSYRERWRDWPEETSATSLRKGAKSSKQSLIDEENVSKTFFFEKVFFPFLSYS